MSLTDTQLIAAAHRERLNLGLRTLAEWCAARAAGDHDTDTTLTMLEKKAAELRGKVLKAGWAAVNAAAENAPPLEDAIGAPKGSFAQHLQGQLAAPTDREIRLRELAEEYHRTCEDYDRTICTGPIKDGAIMPANVKELSAINRHAQAVREQLWGHVAPLGFSRQQWMEAIRDEGLRYRHNEPSHRCTQCHHRNATETNGLCGICEYRNRPVNAEHTDR